MLLCRGVYGHYIVSFIFIFIFNISGDSTADKSLSIEAQDFFGMEKSGGLAFLKF